MPPSDAELSRREAATLFSPPCLSMPQRCQSFHYCCQIFAAAISSRRYAMFSPPFSPAACYYAIITAAFALC
jgi:hypothetical protein